MIKLLRLLPLACLLATALPALAAEPGSAAPAKFDVLEYRVLGNSVLPAQDIERTLYPMLGPGKAIDDVESARAALEGAYRTAGFATVFVDIPEQDIADGIVRLKVTEGRLERTRVQGARYFSGRQIRAALPSAAEDAVPHLPTLQGELSALNVQTPDRSVTPVLKAGAQPGTVDLSLNVQDKLPLHGRIELNDQYTTNTTRLRAIAAVSYDNLFGRLDSLSLQYQTAPQDTREASVWAGSYTARLPGDSTKLALYYINSDSNVASVGDGGATISVLGKGQIFGSRLIRTLESAADATHVLTASVEYKDFMESVFATNVLQTPISYLNVSIGQIANLRDDVRQWTLSSSANFGLRGRYNDASEFAVKRFEARPNYFYLRADGSLAQRLPFATTLRLRVAGQYAVESIISNEQFSVAGADGVRGYREAEVLGDLAVKSSLELASPTWKFPHGSLQGFLFYDYGRMTRLNPLRQQDPKTGALGAFLEPTHAQLTSYGAGADLGLWDAVSGQLTWAYPLADSPAAGGTRAHEPRLHFSLRSTW
jgi:hemolysin activation/secretion protein